MTTSRGPVHLQLEVTSACNLRCPMCLVSHRPGVSKRDGAMDWDTFTRCVDSLPELDRVTLQGLGEPLLAPRLLDMVRYVKARGARVGFSSNAQLLTGRRSSELVEAGLDWLHVSCDAATPEAYRRIRRGGQLERVGDNLRALVRARETAGSALPWVRVVMVAMRSNAAELVDLVRLVADWGVDELRVQNLSHTFDDTDPAGRYSGIREFTRRESWADDGDEHVRAMWASAEQVAGDLGVRLRLPGTEDDEDRAAPGCDLPWEMSYVTSTGVVQPCCMVMGDDRVSWGSVSAGSDLLQVWSSEPAQRFRDALASDAPPAVCTGCSHYRKVF